MKGSSATNLEAGGEDLASELFVFHSFSILLDLIKVIMYIHMTVSIEDKQETFIQGDFGIYL